MSGRWTAALLVAMALAGPGCGGDSEESSGRPETTAKARTEATASQRGRTERAATPSGAARLTAAQYRRKTNKLCREDEAAAQRLGEVDSLESIEPLLRRTVRYARQRQPVYERLRPPPALRANHADLLRLNDRGVAMLTRLLERIEDGGDPGREFTKAMPALGRLLDEGNELARRTGTKDCIVELPSPGAQTPRDAS